MTGRLPYKTLLPDPGATQDSIIGSSRTVDHSSHGESDGTRAKDDLQQSVSRPARLGHKKSRNGCAQCKRRHVKREKLAECRTTSLTIAFQCNEEKAPCANCVRHDVACSLAGGPHVRRNDPHPSQSFVTPSTTALETVPQRGEVSNTPLEAGKANSDNSLPFGPYAILTARIERLVSGRLQDWKLQVQLMHHYMANTRLVMTEHYETDTLFRIWQLDLPKIAFEFDYVMYGLLGLSALHKATQEPERACMLRATAIVHLDEAVSLRQKTTGATGEKNEDANFAFNWLMTFAAFAIPSSLAPIDSMIEVFSLLRHMSVGLAETWVVLSQGPFEPVLSLVLQGSSSVAAQGNPMPEGADSGLGHLDYMLGIEAMVSEDRRYCVLMLDELKQVYTEATRPGGRSTVSSILGFPKQDPGPFSLLLKRRLPQALVMLAYHCVLLDQLNQRWWIDRLASRILQEIEGTLNEQWQSWLDWPVQAVRSNQSGAACPM